MDISLDSLTQLCPAVDAATLERRLRRLPPGYFDRYELPAVARHLRAVAELSASDAVAVDVQSAGDHEFDIVVACIDYPGTIACITTALATDRFDLEDVQITNSMKAAPADVDAIDFSVIVLRVAGLEVDTADELTERLLDRLRAVFSHLAQGNFLDAQAAAAARYDGRSVPSVRAGVGLQVGGDYRLDRRLAKGGMSEVYLATQLSLDRTVAIKLSRQETGPDDELAARFTREAMVLAQFQCPYIVPVFAAGTIPSGTGVLGWIAMEYQAGGDVARWVAQNGPVPIELGLRWFRQAVEGLRYAHNNGILHRDVKPHNLLLTAEGDLKVGDFGLFKYVDADTGGKTPVRGTPHYMSPEQARGEHLDERSDIFSLGTTLFHLFTGQLPFEGPTPSDILKLIAESDAPHLGDVAPDLPTPLKVLLDRMLARDIERRYQDANVLLQDLMSYETRGLLIAADIDAFTAADTTVVDSTQVTGAETSAYIPSVSSDPLVGSN